MSPSRRREAVRMLQDRLTLSERRACRMVGQRLWREEGLRVPQRRRKRRRGRPEVPAGELRAQRPDEVWALDFQFDRTADGRALKLLL